MQGFMQLEPKDIYCLDHTYKDLGSIFTIMDCLGHQPLSSDPTVQVLPAQHDDYRAQVTNEVVATVVIRARHCTSFFILRSKVQPGQANYDQTMIKTVNNHI